MPDGWTSIRLGDVCTKIGSGATPRGGEAVYLPSGPYALIRSQNVHNDGFRKGGLAFIGEEHARQLQSVEVQRDDILLNITGDSVARSCQVEGSVLPARVNQHVAIIRPDPAKLDAKFLRYALVSPSVQATLLSWAGAGGTRNALTKAMIEALEIQAPSDVQEQAAVAETLTLIDEKIALDRNLVVRLEQGAIACFSEWIVNGESMPNRAETAPSAHGGRPGRLADVADLVREQIDPGRHPDTEFEHYSIPAFDDGQEPRAEHGNTIRSTKWIVPAGSVLVSKLNPTIERVWIPDVTDAEDAICSTEFLVMRPRHPFGRAYLYGLMRSREVRERLASLVTGTSTSHQRARANEVLEMPVKLPSQSTVQAFEEWVGPLLERAIETRRELRTLGALRLTLLEGLMAGKLRLDANRSQVNLASVT